MFSYFFSLTPFFFLSSFFLSFFSFLFGDFFWCDHPVAPGYAPAIILPHTIFHGRTHIKGRGWQLPPIELSKTPCTFLYCPFLFYRDFPQMPPKLRIRSFNFNSINAESQSILALLLAFTCVFSQILHISS